MSTQPYKFWYHLWYGQNRLRYVLWPSAKIFQIVSTLRRKWLTAKQPIFSVPIIVVGNLSVGGVGKTPLVIAIARHLSEKGLRVGVVSRGYKAGIHHFPHEVRVDDTAMDVGDEPRLIAMKTQCPVVIAPRRIQAVQYLLDHHQTQVIISDDGLQHYAMPRHVEIVVVDGLRGMGSGLCLPAGPLREPLQRLSEVDFIVVNGEQRVHTHYPPHISTYSMSMYSNLPRKLQTNEEVTWEQLPTPVSAIAGIGHPERFFALLRKLNIVFQPYPFPNHHRFLSKELEQLKKPVLMTEKDAVKCGVFATESMYYLPVEAELSDEFWKALWSRITAFDQSHLHHPFNKLCGRNS